MSRCDRFCRSSKATHRLENAMSHTLVKIYDNFSTAQHAREQLLASGFSSSSVHLSSREDEAGPVEGNFTVGNKDSDTSGPGGLFRSLVGGHDDPTDSDDMYTRKFANAVQRGIYMLTVDAVSETEAARASDIMNRFSQEQPGGDASGDRLGH